MNSFIVVWLTDGGDLRFAEYEELTQAKMFLASVGGPKAYVISTWGGYELFDLT